MIIKKINLKFSFTKDYDFQILKFQTKQDMIIIILIEIYYFAFANEHNSKDDNKVYFWEHFGNLNLGCNCRCIK